MMIRSAILLTFLTVVSVAFCKHVESTTSEEETFQETTPAPTVLTSGSSSGPKRQLRKTHLRLHGKPPETLQLQEGDSDFLECQAGGTPSPAIHWLKDGNVIPQSETSQEEPQKTESGNDEANKKRKITVSFTTSRLYLDCLSVEDQGEYTCVAENPYHRISSSTTLTVLSSDEEIECEERSSHGRAPRIILWTKTMIGTQGAEGKFTCRADGYPRPTIQWQGPQGQELTSEDFDKYEMLPDGDLIIRHLGWSDMGNYNCIAENVHGTAKVEVFLYPSIINN